MSSTRHQSSGPVASSLSLRIIKKTQMDKCSGGCSCSTSPGPTAACRTPARSASAQNHHCFNTNRHFCDNKSSLFNIKSTENHHIYTKIPARPPTELRAPQQSPAPRQPVILYNQHFSIGNQDSSIENGPSGCCLQKSSFLMQSPLV